MEDLEAGEHNIAAFCEDHRNVEIVSPEIVQFMNLIRQVLKCFPQVFTQPRAPHELSLFWHALRLGSILLETDHQVSSTTSQSAVVVVATYQLALTLSRSFPGTRNLRRGL